MQQWVLHIPLFQCSLPIPSDPKRIGRDSGERRTRENPCNRLVAGSFNTTRLWLQDGSVHDGFHMLTHILEVESVNVLCVQEVMLVTSQPSWSTNRMLMMGLQSHEVVMLDFSSMRVCLVHQSEESLILCPSGGALSKAKSAFALSTRLMLASLRVTASLFGETSSPRPDMFIPP